MISVYPDTRNAVPLRPGVLRLQTLVWSRRYPDFHRGSRYLKEIAKAYKNPCLQGIGQLAE